MTSELLILYYEPSESGDFDEAIDITDIVEELQISSSLDSQPGQASLTIVGDQNEYVMGACIQVLDGDRGVFMGYVFTVSMSNEAKVRLTALDQCRYLKNQDTFVLEPMTVDALFKKICSEWKLNQGTVDSSSHTCKASIHEGKSIWDVVTQYCEETFVETGKLFIVRDNFGSLELRDVENLHTELLIDDVSVINQYNYEVSIDKNTYNQIKIGKDNKAKNERAWVVVKDSNTIKQWGVLQYHKKLSEETKDATLEKYAEKLLKTYNRFTQTLTLNCLGDFALSAGSGIQIQLDAIKSTSENQNYIVKSCTHNIKNALHEMQLELVMDRI
ncbi:MAG: hypothetical protein M0Q90_16415 [Bacteroidales bacterium]|jgi:hypothetical protein|nr:hypothetical protein [Bacteroidales bacterium]